MAYHSTIRERVLYSLVSLKEDEIIWLVSTRPTTRILERILGILITDINSIGLLRMQHLGQNKKDFGKFSQNPPVTCFVIRIRK